MVWVLSCNETGQPEEPENAKVAIRAVYGGIPEGVLLSDVGVNAVFIGSGSVTEERINQVHSQGAKIFAEFNTLHRAQYLKDFPDAAPIGTDGKVSPPPHDWQGICPSHPGYRAERMQAFRALLQDYRLDGVWLDYHHSHASWEREVPVMPDTCFCKRCIGQFSADISVEFPSDSRAAAQLILKNHYSDWILWRCDLLTDWVREFRSIMDEVRPGALLGTFHNPWSDEAYDGARIKKLAIDLKAQAAYIDVFSPMPYHARFGHARDLDWIAERVSWLGDYLGLEGTPGERVQIWPIVQLSDWGETVLEKDVVQILDAGSRSPATGVIVFAWGSLKKQPAKANELWKVFRAMAKGDRSVSFR
jgi:hypothetical protein